MKFLIRSFIAVMAAATLCASAAQTAPSAGAPLNEEVPFITSPDNVTLEMLRIANVGARDHVIDLGSGDGRIVILAARRFGASGLGVEIDPSLVRRSIRSAQDAGVADRVAFREQDLFATDLSVATVITMYLLPEFNLKLRPSLLGLKPGTRIVSHDWDMGDWKPDQTTVLPVPDKAVGLEKSSKVHLWVVPAKAEGLWCGNGLLRGAAIELSQRYQEVSGTLTHRGRSRPVEGRVKGPRMSVVAGRYGELGLDITGDNMRIASAEGAMALLAQGQGFRKAGTGGCSPGG